MRLIKPLIAIVISCTVAFNATTNRKTDTLKDEWLFTRGEVTPDSKWQHIRVPHDWAIYGPFDRLNDLQKIAVKQNGETIETVKTGRTGGLPFIGKGNYLKYFEIGDTTGKSVTLVFDGAMSNASVKVNGKKVAYWPYGYNSFHVCIDSVVLPGKNKLEVSLENREQSSRWYPGAGLYRNVHIVITDKVHIPVWGTYITTPKITSEYAHVKLKVTIDGLSKGEKADIVTRLLDRNGKTVASDSSEYTCHGQEFTQNFIVRHPELWDTETPVLYTAETKIITDGRIRDTYNSPFGIRSIEYIPEKGFFLNGKPTKFKGVCNHHDLGPLGAAVNKSALRYQVELLKEMGANAIRTSHNMPAPELVELCDEMGMMLMIEPFDDWSFRPKSPNGYGSIFNEWAKRDLTNMVLHYRNCPSVVMWSIGNEVPSQWSPDGVNELTMLRDIVKTLDPTRPVTCGMDQIGSVLRNGFAASLDIPGFNYKPQHYSDAYNKLPQKLILGSETASTVSSRGTYHFPVIFRGHEHVLHPDKQSSSYDNENCSWSNVPDFDFAMDDDYDWVIGQFVWTGFDYLGEPSPYDTDSWPSHSSLFGIIDLASLPKDRYFLYRSKWNKKSPTLHVLPHWNWPDRKGKTTPVFVYTSYPKAELFINGKSQGIREKNDSTVFNRYRLMWNETKYEPGELKVVAYDIDGRPIEERIVKTAGKPHHLVIESNRKTIKADGDDMVYFTIRVADKNDNLVPIDNRRIKFTITGAGSFEATANGDPTCVLPFHKPEMDLFSGAATVIARSAKRQGILTIKADADGVRSAEYSIEVK